MSTIVIMPGGFHPFHAGHAALYDSARRAFPEAQVYVAATNDTSTRPFPFQIKEKLAKLAGVESGHFVQVKSPFQAKEITAQYNPEKDVLIFVRSEKDASKPPQAGGIKKDGNPAYLQPLLDAKKLEPFAKHAYMAYLPTVEFGPGMTSATEIRTAWPQLNEKRKTALVMSLYPRTQSNPTLAATVVKMLDTAMSTELAEVNTQNSVGGMYAGYQSRENQPVGETQRHPAALQKKQQQPSSNISPDIKRDQELYKWKLFAKQHYPGFSQDPDDAFDKWTQRGLQHSEEEDLKHTAAIKGLTRKIADMERKINAIDVMRENADYLPETPRRK